MGNRNATEITKLLERRAAIDRKLRSAPMRVNTIAVYRERIKLRREIDEINDGLSREKAALVRRLHPEWCIRGWA